MFGSMYSLLSYNVLCGTFTDPTPRQRFERQAEKIKTIKPDIICLQEFNNHHVENIYRKILENDYHFMLERVDKYELGRRFVMCASMLTVLFVIHPAVATVFVISALNPYIHNFMVGTQKTGNAVLIHKSHPVGAIYAKEFRNQDGDILNLIRKRGFVDIMFYNTLIRNTHLNHGKDVADYRQTQMVECLREICDSTLLVGDFNTEKIHPICEYGFMDCTGQLGCTYRKSNPLTHTRLSRDKRIDYVFSYNVQVANATKMDMFSDHDALLIHFCPRSPIKKES